MGQEHSHVSGACIRKHCHHRHQHQNRAEEGIKEKFKRSINPRFTAPDPDNQEHWDQTRFKEHVKQHQIQRTKHTDH